MRRWLFNLATVVSLVLCVATVVVGVRGCRRAADEYHWLWIGGGRTLFVFSVYGLTHYGLATGYPDRDGVATFRASQPYAFPEPHELSLIILKLCTWTYGGYTGARPVQHKEYYVEARVPDAIALTAVVPCWWLWSWWRRRPQKRGHCPACGYDLRATPDRCPECGTAVTPPAPPAVPAPNAPDARRAEVA